MFDWRSDAVISPQYTVTVLIVGLPLAYDVIAGLSYDDIKRVTRRWSRVPARDGYVTRGTGAEPHQ